ncbi:MAG: VPLPA-CTERM sorting domain-containing protein [Pseudomonadota bacterium]
MQSWSKTMAVGVAGLTVVGGSKAEASPISETVLSTSFSVQTSSGNGEIATESESFNVEGFSGGPGVILESVILELTGASLSGEFPDAGQASIDVAIGGASESVLVTSPIVFSEPVSGIVDLLTFSEFENADFTQDFTVSAVLSIRGDSETIFTTFAAGPDALTVTYHSTVVPLPAALPMLLFGVAGIAGLRLTRRDT